MTPRPQFIVMGVSGSGKSTFAEPLAAAIGGDFLDADDFHSAANKAKLAANVPLTDADRWPWLDLLNAELRTHATAGRTAVLACSALKQSYRERLVADVPSPVRFIWLTGPAEVIRERLKARSGHFASAALLDSQLATLEPPADAIEVDVREPVEAGVAKVMVAVGARSSET